MNPNLSKSAKRVQDFLLAKGFSCDVRELPSSTRTAQEAADSIGCEVCQIAKSLIFRERESNNPILVIASGSNRVDVLKIEKVFDLKIDKADGNYVKDRIGFAIGGVPPAGHKETILTILDIDLKRYEEIWAAAGSPFAVFKLNPTDLEQLTGGKWVDLAE